MSIIVSQLKNGDLFTVPYIDGIYEIKESIFWPNETSDAPQAYRAINVKHRRSYIMVSPNDVVDLYEPGKLTMPQPNVLPSSSNWMDEVHQMD